MNDPIVPYDYMNKMEISDDSANKLDYFPAERLDFNTQWKIDKEISEPLVHSFIPKTSKDKVSPNSQVSFI